MTRTAWRRARLGAAVLVAVFSAFAFGGGADALTPVPGLPGPLTAGSPTSPAPATGTSGGLTATPGPSATPDPSAVVLVPGIGGVATTGGGRGGTTPGLTVGVPAPSATPSAGLSATPGPGASSVDPAAVGVTMGAVPIDGCDHSYGGANQCVPWNFPPGTTDRCFWLRAHGLGNVAVHGRDRHHLDTNSDGVGCGSGDAG